MASRRRASRLAARRGAPPDVTLVASISARQRLRPRPAARRPREGNIIGDLDLAYPNRTSWTSSTTARHWVPCRSLIFGHGHRGTRRESCDRRRSRPLAPPATTSPTPTGVSPPTEEEVAVQGQCVREAQPGGSAERMLRPACAGCGTQRAEFRASEGDELAVPWQQACRDEDTGLRIFSCRNAEAVLAAILGQDHTCATIRRGGLRFRGVTRMETCARSDRDAR